MSDGILINFEFESVNVGIFTESLNGEKLSSA